MRLSVLCPSHRPTFLDQQFQRQLRERKYRSMVEFIMLNDTDAMTTSEKMKRLVEMASGEFVMFVADDDIISPRMLPWVLTALRPSMEGVGFIVRIHFNLHRGTTARIGPTETDQDQIWDEERQVKLWGWHPICPTRQSLYEGYEWPDVTDHEDRYQAMAMLPRLTPSKWGFIEEELYLAFPQEDRRT